MGKIHSFLINRFDAGMTNILRTQNTSYSKTSKHFDILSDPTKMSPYRDFTDELFSSGAAATVKLVKFLAAATADGLATRQYALGIDPGTGTGVPYIYAKATAAGGSWAPVAATATEFRNEKVFNEYQNKIYGWRSDAVGSLPDTLDGTTSKIWSYNIGNGVTINPESADSETLGAIFVAPGLVHSKDDRFYLPFNNKIAVKNGSGAFTIGVTLPSNLIITGICEFGNYVAIGCRPKYVINTNSIVYLWDRDTSLLTLSEKIDFGPEFLQELEEIDGWLVGLTTFANTSSETLTITPKLVIKYYPGSGNRALQYTEIPLTSGTVRIAGRQKINNRILFLISCELYGIQTDALLAIAKTGNQLTVSIDRLYTGTSGEDIPL